MKRYYNLMANYGAEYSRIHVGQFETKSDAKDAYKAFAANWKGPGSIPHLWIEGFEKNLSTGDVIQVW